jgi:glyoxylase-like metal-dependent hydrolase (beta-lactamase superfamily II)
MRIHHLNCVSSCPLGGRLMDGRSPRLLGRGQLCCHCLLVEADSSLVLVDTGFGLRDVQSPRDRLSGFFLAMLSPDFREEMTAVRQIRRLGFDPADVRHIVLTHLDFDHAGGLDDFPHARVHLLREEGEYAVLQKTWLDRQRFRPQQWVDRSRWEYHDGGGDRWFGFESVSTGHGLPADIALVPLSGHTFGHAGIAVRSDGRWLLQAGDAYFYHREMDADRRGWRTSNGCGSSVAGIPRCRSSARTTRSSSSAWPAVRCPPCPGKPARPNFQAPEAHRHAPRVDRTGPRYSCRSALSAAAGSFPRWPAG